MPKAPDLRVIARALAREEAGRINLPIAQITEVIACLGKRWRSMPPEDAAREFAAIIERAGKRR